MIDLSALRRFHGGGRLLGGALFLALAGWIALVVGFAVDPGETLHSYLVSWAYFTGLALGALGWLLSFQATGTRWAVVLRRLLEILAATLLLFVVLFIPIAVGIGHLYPWVHPDPARGREFLELIQHKRPWLNVPFFLVRTAFYFAIWIALSHLQLRSSRRQDESRALSESLLQRRLGGAGLPAYGLSIAFAAFDWLMSLQPTFYSTIFGVYYFAGGFLGAMAVLIIAANLAESTGVLTPGLLTRSHYHSMGKLLFAFLCFWAYIGFSQYMLIWIGNLPEEIEYFLVRRQRGFYPVFLFLVLFHFVVPFFVLLSRDLKRNATWLSLMAIWLLFVHWVDTDWMVMPYSPSAARGGAGWMPHWQSLAAFCAVGGLSVAFALFRLRGSWPIPIGDPYLAESIHYDR